jgi:hypothetical protein
MAATQQGFPYLDTPFVVEDRRISIPWYRFLVALWKATGGSTPSTSQVYFSLVGSQIIAYNSLTNAPIGALVTSGTPGGARVSVSVGASPFIYAPGSSGTLVVFSGQLEISRDSGSHWDLVGLAGGAAPMLKDDEARITYTDATYKPLAVWFPDAA